MVIKTSYNKKHKYPDKLPAPTSQSHFAHSKKHPHTYKEHVKLSQQNRVVIQIIPEKLGHTHSQYVYTFKDHGCHLLPGLVSINQIW